MGNDARTIGWQAEVEALRAERDQVAAECDLLRGILDALPHIVFACWAVRDEAGRIADGVVEFVNAAVTSGTGEAPEDLIGRCLSVLHPWNWEVGHFDAYVQAVETGEGPGYDSP